MTVLTPAPEQVLAPESPPAPHRPARLAAEVPLRYLAAAASLAAAGIHFAVMPEHWLEWKLAGAFFGVLAWLQVAWAIGLLKTRSRVLVVLGLLVQLQTIVVWAVSRTGGLPFGPEAGEAEPASFIDILCSALEGVAIVAAGLLLVRAAAGFRLRPPVAIGAATLLIAGIVGSTTASLIPSVGGHVHTAADGSALTAGHTHGAAVTGDIPAGWVAGCHQHSTATGDLADVGHAPGNCTNAKVTSAQRAAAERLVADTTAVVNKRFPTLQSAEKAGYRVINQTGPLVHVGMTAYLADGHVLDPNRVESLVYVDYAGRSMLLGAMYVAEPSAPQGPLIGGALTSWHIHTNLCVNSTTGTALNPKADGSCAPGSAIGPTAQMLHVWTIPYQGGPFADISTPALIAAVTEELQRREAGVQPS